MTPMIPAWVAFDLCTIALLGLLLAAIERRVVVRDNKRRWYLFALLATLGATVADVLSHAYLLGAVLLAAIAAHLLPLLDVAVVFLWATYLLEWTNIKRRLPMPWLVTAAVVWLANAFFVAANVGTGWLFTYGSTGYRVGPYFPVHIAIVAGYGLACLICVWHRRRHIEASVRKAMACSLIAPVAATAAGCWYVSASFALLGWAFGALTLYIFVQNRDASVDFLTGVWNRRVLDRELERSVQERRVFSGILLDLDGFKQINDTYGHDVGDRALVAFAALLTRNFRSEDIVARYGGDEFFVLAQIENENVLQGVEKRVRNAVDQYNAASDLPCKLGVSMGYAVYNPAAGESATALGFFRRLDAMLYAEKDKKSECRKSAPLPAQDAGKASDAGLLNWPQKSAQA